jgi:gliding motility-associated-like protein
LPAEFPVGTTVVTYSAKDNAGNVGTCKFNVIVKDNVAPEFTGAPADITVTANASCKAKVSWVPPVFTDNCGLVQTPARSHDPGDHFTVGKTTVTYTATDKSGNITTCAFNVIVKDLIRPTIKHCPNDTTIKVSTAGNVKTPVSWAPPIASDDCSSDVSLTANYNPGDLFPIGVTTITYTAIDFSGNTVSCSFNVTVSLDQVDLDIFQILTPDGNGVNDTWWIGNIEKYEKNKVVVVDRWGGVVYSATGYNNSKTAWNGENNSGTVVPTGTYFYTVTVHAGQQVTEKKGFIEVVR